MMSDAWTVKTHDLTYKPQVEIDKDFKHLMEGFGNDMQVNDERTELIKKKILTAWQDDSLRREAACFQYSLTLRQAKNDDINRIVGYIEASIKKKTAVTQEQLADAINVIENLEKIEDYWAAVRLKLMLALLRTGVTVDEAVHAIQRWLIGISVEDCEQAAKALLNAKHGVFFIRAYRRSD
jgi:hypothetical protein